MRINNNIMAMNTHRFLALGNNAGAKSTERLSSGFRINKAGDDAAGLAISEKMRAQIRGLSQASANAQDGISMIQTAEGALSETHDILQRMRELATQSSNDTNTSVDRDEIQKEINELTSEINRIGNNTEFNTKKVINGEMTGGGVGATSQKYTLDIDAMGLETGETTGFKLKIGGEEYTVAGNAGVAPGTTPVVNGGTKTITVGTSGADATAADIVNGFALLNASDSSLLSNEWSFSDVGGNLVIEAKSDGQFKGVAGKDSISVTQGEASNLSITTTGADGTGGKANIQVGANNAQQFVVEINDMRALTNLKISGTSAGGNQGVVANAQFTTGVGNALTDNAGTTEYALDVTSATKATAAIEVINKAIETVSAERSKLGAYQNRLEHTIKNLDTSAENLQAAESRIRDVDMAAEMMDFTKNNILQQAAQAMLAQANQAPQGVLQLLR
jgi:flagellin